MSWMDELTDDERERVDREVERQRKALDRMLKGELSKRLARRIVERSKVRVQLIAGAKMMGV